MEEKNHNIQMLSLMRQAAFCAEQGIITYVNPAAARYLLQPGMEVAKLLVSGAEEYETFTEGCLHLTAALEQCAFGATAIRSQGQDLIVLQEVADDVLFRLLALVSSRVRMPLATVMAALDHKLPTLDNQAQAQELSLLTSRPMMQMQRMVCNMSDCLDFGQSNPKAMEYVDIRAFLEELLSRAAEALAHQHITLEYVLPDQRLDTLAYPQRLERAVYNMLSNAAKFSPEGGTIRVQLTVRGNRLALSVTDQGPGIQNAGDVFTRYLRHPMLEDPQFGLGLGMVLIRSAATLHGGAVLLDQPEGIGSRVTMTFAINRDKAAQVHSPMMRFDYAGERDHCLLELSDVLPASLYALYE